MEQRQIKVAQGALRHADPATTMRSSRKLFGADVRRAGEETLGEGGDSSLDISRTLNAPSSEALKTIN